jgi:hypothetical protein
MSAPEHVCGLQGYNPGFPNYDRTCPACEAAQTPTPPMKLNIDDFVNTGNDLESFEAVASELVDLKAALAHLLIDWRVQMRKDFERDKKRADQDSGDTYACGHGEGLQGCIEELEAVLEK